MEITVILILIVIIVFFCYNNIEHFETSYKDMWNVKQFNRNKWLKTVNKIKKFININNKLPVNKTELSFISMQNKRYYQYLDYDYSYYRRIQIPFFINHKDLRLVWEDFIFNSSVMKNKIKIINLQDYNIFNKNFLRKKIKQISIIKIFINEKKRVPSRISYNNEEKNLGDILFEMVNFYHQYIFDVIEKDNFMKNPFIRSIYVGFINDKKYEPFIEKKFPFNTFWFHKYKYINAKKIKDNFTEIKFKEKYKINYDTVKDFVLENVNNEFYDRYKNTNINFHMDEPNFEKILQNETIDNKDQKYFRIKHIHNKKLKEYKKQNFFYRNDKLLKFRMDPKCNENYIFIINIYDPKSVNNMWLYVDSIFNVKNLTVYLNDLKLIGIDKQENIFFDNKTDILVDTDNNGLHCSLSKTEECNYDTKSKLRNNFLDKYNIKEDRVYECFGKNAKTKQECINEDPKKGVWDTPCLSDIECPFYKQNLNYENNFGKCVSGYCEFPLNVTNTSYRTGDNKQPLCYNCKKIYKNYDNINDDQNYYLNQEEEENTENLSECVGIDCHKCCEDQKNKSLYPNLKSPDYAYENDIEVRSNEENKKLLKGNNMKIMF